MVMQGELIKYNPMMYGGAISLLLFVLYLFWVIWCCERVILLGIIASVIVMFVTVLGESVVLYYLNDLFVVTMYEHVGLADRRTILRKYMGSKSFNLNDDRSWKTMSAVDPEWEHHAELVDPMPWVEYLAKNLGTERGRSVELFLDRVIPNWQEGPKGERFYKIVLSRLAALTGGIPDKERKQLRAIIDRTKFADPGPWAENLAKTLGTQQGELVEFFLDRIAPNWQDGPIGESFYKSIFSRLVEGKDIPDDVRKRIGVLLEKKYWRIIFNNPETKAKLADLLFKASSSITDNTVPIVYTNPRDGYEMVLVPGGEFVMGSSAGDIYAYDNEKPRHLHRTEPYLMGRYTVTVSQFRKFVRETGYKASFDWQKDPPNHPVRYVSWYDAEAYAQWSGLRLPTEAEWELASRGYEGWKYSWGNDWEAGYRVCWSKQKSPGGATAPVDSHPEGASPFSLYQMGGNVWEWCADWYEKGAYQRYSNGDFSPPQSGGSRVIRGAAWNDDKARSFRGANRGFATRRTGLPVVGFAWPGP